MKTKIQNEITVKHLIAYCDGINKRLNRRKCQFLHGSIFYHERKSGEGYIYKIMQRIISLLRELQTKVSCCLWTWGLGGGRKGKVKSGKVLNIQSE